MDEKAMKEQILEEVRWEGLCFSMPKEDIVKAVEGGLVTWEEIGDAFVKGIMDKTW